MNSMNFTGIISLRIKLSMDSFIKWIFIHVFVGVMHVYIIMLFYLLLLLVDNIIECVQNLCRDFHVI